MKKALQNIGRWLLVILFLYYYTANTSFIHTHIFQTYSITHSHPYIPGGHHTHTGEELETVALFNALVLFFSSPLLWAVGLLICLYVIYVSRQNALFDRRTYSPFLRAPPC